MSDAPTPQLLTVDIVVTNILDQGRILLIRRKNEPFQGQWALPGGFVDPDEIVSHAAARELEEETCVQVKPDHLLLVGVFSEPGRDPRGRAVSVAYRSWVGNDEARLAKAKTDAADLAWMLPDEALKEDLAFDHNRIILAALK